MRILKNCKLKRNFNTSKFGFVNWKAIKQITKFLKSYNFKAKPQVEEWTRSFFKNCNINKLKHIFLLHIIQKITTLEVSENASRIYQCYKNISEN